MVPIFANKLSDANENYTFLQLLLKEPLSHGTELNRWFGAMVHFLPGRILKIQTKKEQNEQYVNKRRHYRRHNDEHG